MRRRGREDRRSSVARRACAHRVHSAAQVGRLLSERFCSRFAVCVPDAPSKAPTGCPGVAIFAAAPPSSLGASSPQPARQPLFEESTTPVVTTDAEPIWTAMQETLRATVKPDVYDLWLAPLQAVAVTGDTLVLEAPAPVRAFVAERCCRALERAARDVLGPAGAVDVRATGATPQPGRARAAVPEEAAERLDPDGLNPKFTFEQFVIGDANRFAHAAALAVAELPGQAYNPLFIYGPPGVGKTHLLGAIGNYTVLNDTSLGVRYATAETFTGDFTGALRAGDMRPFKNDYRLADVLLLDDVQFFESKSKTGEELFHTFESLLATGAQVVLAADRPPSAMPALDSRLR